MMNKLLRILLLAEAFVLLLVPPSGAEDNLVTDVARTPAMLPLGRDSLARSVVVPEKRKEQSFMAVDLREAGGPR
ncbi:MAG: hypothetical protein P8X81_06920 [Woeseiaceae bacterium]|jgi:hypothetical protein